MPALLARIAGTLTPYWRRSLFAGVAVIVALGALASTGTPPANDSNARPPA